MLILNAKIGDDNDHIVIQTPDGAVLRVYVKPGKGRAVKLSFDGPLSFCILRADAKRKQPRTA